MYQVWLDPIEQILDSLDDEQAESILAQLESWTQRIQLERRNVPRFYSIAPLNCQDYRGIECLVDHKHQSIIPLAFLPKPFDNPFG
ncbi:hypothetical protein BCD67_08465 [Oscillatoriales cyanobacterium USR001]|nr:hypothetical protein BCD67_08465 [Oscillatoriales cyanobacterium USR001]